MKNIALQIVTQLAVAAVSLAVIASCDVIEWWRRREAHRG